jgi:hypothetical protein
MTTNYNAYWYFFKIVAAPASFTILLGLLVWSCNVSNLEEKGQKDVSAIISRVLKEQSEKKLLLPQIVFVSADTTDAKDINNKLIENLTVFLTNKYLSNEDHSKNALIEPFFVLPNKPDKRGNYLLTEPQLIDLKNHLEFLVKQVDSQVSNTKEEVGRDIDRLNLWVSIWIGVIGFLGIFIPVIINIDTSRSAQNANEQSMSAIAAIGKAKPDIDKIPGIEEKISKAEKTLGSIESKSESADKKATASEIRANNAERKSNALYLVYSVGKLSSFQTEIALLPNDKVVPFLKKILESIHKNMNECSNSCEETIVKDSLRDLAIYLSKLSYFTKYIGLERTRKLDKFAGLILDTLSKPYVVQNHLVVTAEFDNLIKVL